MESNVEEPSNSLRPRNRKKKSKVSGWIFPVFLGLFFIPVVSGIISNSGLVVSDLFVITMGELSGFKKLDREIDEKLIQVRGDLSEDSDVKSMHDNDHTSQFREGFEKHLIILKDELNVDGAKDSDEKELISSYRDRFETLKREYIAGAPLGEIDWYTPSSGEVIFDHGINMNSYFTPRSILALEKEVRGVTAPPGLNDYRGIAGKVGDIFGVEAIYGFENLPTSCVDNSTDNKGVLGRFCSSTSDAIYFNSEYEGQFKRPSFVDVMKHELAHRAILLQCGTPHPLIAEGNVERVTSSFAVIYYGADRVVLNKTQGEGYNMTDESDRIARAIHDQGNCNSKIIKEGAHLM